MRRAAWNPGRVTSSTPEQRNRWNAKRRREVNDSGIRPDMQPAPGERGGQLRDAHPGGQPADPRIVQLFQELLQPLLLAFGGAS